MTIAERGRSTLSFRHLKGLSLILVTCATLLGDYGSVGSEFEKLDAVGRWLFNRDCKERVTIEPVTRNSFAPGTFHRIERWGCHVAVGRVLIAEAAAEPMGMLLSVEIRART